jgi:hypothetical protein
MVFEAVPLPQASGCSRSMRGEPRSAAEICCRRFALGCDALEDPVSSLNVVHVDVGKPPNQYLHTPIKLGGACGLVGMEARCQRHHDCRDNICRRKNIRYAASGDISGPDMTWKQYAKMLSPRRKRREEQPAFASATVEGSNAGKSIQPDAREPGIQVSGLSVPLSARVPLASALHGHVPLLPTVQQRMRKVVRPVGQSTVASEPERRLHPPGTPTPVEEEGGSNKTCTDPYKATDSDTSASETGYSSKKETKADDDSTGKGVSSSAAESPDLTDKELLVASQVKETEDEQITDSVADVVEKMTGVTLDSKTLTAMDAAVTAAMDKYEEKAAESGELLINVDELTSGKSSKVSITLPDTETTGYMETSKKGSSRLSPASQVGDQVVDAVRQKLKEEMAPDMLEKLAKALINSSKCKGQSAAALSPADKAECDVVRWIRANWFRKTRGAASLVDQEPSVVVSGEL